MSIITIPKIIYLTYKNNPPQYVLENWKKLNPEYYIDFSLDSDCINFLSDNFGEKMTNMFKNIKEGMYKADLWRLCKLYINGGVYADIDLVPYVSINNLIQLNYTFYTCLAADKKSCFQAFIITEAKNPLILNFIFSFIKNKPYTYQNGPCFDMYNCIQQNLYIKNIISEKKYNLNTIQINIDIGSSDTNIKIINLYSFSKNTNYRIKLNNHHYNDQFNFEIKNSQLIVTRIDQNIGWKHNHSIILYISYGKFINIGSSKNNVKIIELDCINSTDSFELCNNQYNDKFEFKITSYLKDNDFIDQQLQSDGRQNNGQQNDGQQNDGQQNNTLLIGHQISDKLLGGSYKLIITRIDQNTGWDHDHYIIINNKNQSIFLFTELFDENNKAVVKLNNQKIFDSRYESYTLSKINNVWK